MELAYVGPKPIVDQHGVDFDKSEPDRYIFLYATIELLEIIEGCITIQGCSLEGDLIDIASTKPLRLSPSELVALVHKHCSGNIDAIVEKKEQKVTELITKLKQNVHENPNLNEDEKTAWLGNIEIMKDYYRQFVENEVVFESLLEVLSEDIYRRKTKEIRFLLGNNYGFVFSYLQNTLQEHNPPLDATIKMEVHNGATIGRLLIQHPKSSLL